MSLEKFQKIIFLSLECSTGFHVVKNAQQVVSDQKMSTLLAPILKTTFWVRTGGISKYQAPTRGSVGGGDISQRPPINYQPYDVQLYLQIQYVLKIPFYMPRKLKSGTLAQGLVHNQSSQKHPEIWRFKNPKMGQKQNWKIPATQRLAQFKYDLCSVFYILLHPLKI